MTEDQRKQYEEAAYRSSLKHPCGGNDYQFGFIDGCEYAHSKIEEAEREAHNRAIDMVEGILRNGRGVDIAYKAWLIEELKKLRK